MLTLLNVLPDGAGGIGGELGVGVCEGGDEPWEGAEDVGDHGDLAVAGLVAGADPDGGDIEAGGEAGGDLGHDAFEDDGEAAGVLEGEGALAERRDFLGGAALPAVSAFFDDALGEHAEVAEDLDSGGSDSGHFGGLAAAPFEFDGLGAGFGQVAGVREGLIGGVVAVDREVGHEEGAFGAAGRCGGVVDHMGHGDGGGVGVSEDHHSEGVADQQEVGSGFVEEPGGGVIVGGERCDGGPDRFRSRSEAAFSSAVMGRVDCEL